MTCRHCSTTLPQIPTCMPPKWGVLAPWPIKHRRRRLLRNQLLVEAHHHTGRCRTRRIPAGITSRRGAR